MDPTTKACDTQQDFSHIAECLKANSTVSSGSSKPDNKGQVTDCTVCQVKQLKAKSERLP